VVLTSTVAAALPPATVMVNALLTKPVAAAPSGSREGDTMLAAADQPVAFAGSAQMAKLVPRVGTAPTVPPKFTLPSVAAIGTFGKRGRTQAKRHQRKQNFHNFHEHS
jgi:hypothetical protein